MVNAMSIKKVTKVVWLKKNKFNLDMRVFPTLDDANKYIADKNITPTYVGRLSHREYGWYKLAKNSNR